MIPLTAPNVAVIRVTDWLWLVSLAGVHLIYMKLIYFSQNLRDPSRSLKRPPSSHDPQVKNPCPRQNVILLSSDNIVVVVVVVLLLEVVLVVMVVAMALARWTSLALFPSKASTGHAILGAGRGMAGHGGAGHQCRWKSKE